MASAGTTARQFPLVSFVLENYNDSGRDCLPVCQSGCRRIRKPPRLALAQKKPHLRAIAAFGENLHFLACLCKGHWPVQKMKKNLPHRNSLLHGFSQSVKMCWELCTHCPKNGTKAVRQRGGLLANAGRVVYLFVTVLIEGLGSSHIN